MTALPSSPAWREASGAEATATLRAALSRVEELVSYLRADVVDAEAELASLEGEWFSCRVLLEDPGVLRSVILSTGTGLGTADPVVAASLFVQAYSYRVLTMSVACLLAAESLPDTAPERLAIGIARNRPSRLAFIEPASLLVLHTPEGEERLNAVAAEPALSFLVEHALVGHLRPLAEAVRGGLGSRIARRLLWGNIASSAATAFRTMEGCLGSGVKPLAERFFALAPPEVRGLGDFITLAGRAREGWFWERTNCCLFDRLPAKIRCADCSKTPATERRAAYRASLEG